MHPWLSQKAIAFLETYFKQNTDTRMLEFGSGNSTPWFGNRTEKLISIEHDERWYIPVTELCKALKNVEIRLIPGNYSPVCDTFSDNYFDIILVDGRDRINCIKKGIRILKPGGILILDDAEREKYTQAFEILKDWPCTITEEQKANESHPSQTVWWIKPK